MELKEQEIINSNVAVATLETQEKQYQIIEIKGGKFYLFLKRTMDICASFLGIVILALPLLIIGLLVKLTSKGPILFKDKRVGKNGKDITVYKFRSMYIDAEENIDKYLTPEQKERWLVERKLDNDPRITPIGRFLRKTSIDEIPQIFNIFKGDLSIVGPRPITRTELEQNYTENEINILLSCRPGLTGYWQVCGRSNISYESRERQRLEIEYFTKRGFWFDIGIIFRTIPAVLFHKGAH